MKQSPCIETDCKFKDKHKNRPECENCTARLEHIGSLGEMTHSVPIELTEMGAKRGPQKRWTDEDIQFLKDNHGQLTHRVMAERLGRSLGSVSVKMSQLGISKKRKKIGGNGFKRGITAENITTERPPLDPDRDSKIDFFILDFSSDEDLYERFLDYSKKQFRTPQDQIKYLIDRATYNEENSYPDH